ncbi:ORF1 [Carrot Ch virus 1]|uniref:ORF1 n=1 Tax=Carrot Ch virus 1 TaxID=1425363 RepID=A0A0A0P710_9VIRU|nr:ORF1 [Carrot Ch virus 1]AHA85534.1 ORF1 [Carrot Ch virus 1]
MSYGFRTPQEKILSTFSPSFIDNVQSTSGRTFEDEENRIGKFFNFNLDDRKKEFASNSGIYLSPYSYKSHSHPLCKTIENHLLYVVIPPLIQNFNNLNVVSMKESKLKILHESSDAPKKMSINLINRLMDVKDSFRYKSGDGLSIKYPTQLLESNTRDYDPLMDVRIEKGSNFLFHDELHYWTFSMMLDFLEKFEPSHVICTAVFPVEILEGIKQSLYPEVYSFEILQTGNFVFAPDGVYSESYEQSVNMKWLFSASSFKVRDQIYSVDLIKTIGAHHLFTIVKGRRISRSIRLFKGFDTLDMSAFLGTKYKMPIADVHFSFFKKIVIYLKSLKKPDTQSAVAKLRQLVGDSISLTEVLFIEDFASRFQEHGAAKLSNDGIFDQFIHSLKSILPEFVRRLMGSFQRDNLLKQISEAKAFEVRIETCSINRNYDNNALWRYIKDLAFHDVNELQSDKLLFKEREKGEDEESRDRRNIVNGFTPSFYSYPGGDNTKFKKIKIGLLKEEPGVLRDITMIELKSNKGYSLIDEKLIEYNNKKLMAAMKEFGQNCQRDRRSFRPFYIEIMLSGSFLPLRQICGDFTASCVHETLDDMLDVLSEIKMAYPLTTDVIQLEKDVETKLEEISANANENEDSVTMVSVSSSSSSSTSGREIEIDTSDLSDHLNDIRGIKPDDRWSDLVVEIKDSSFLQCGIDLDNLLKGIKSQKLKTRKAFYFCKDANFDYGHDKVKYQNMGWPNFISELNKIACDVTGFKFNSVLINEYTRGGRIHWHADDENVYDLDRNPVLTVNMIGEGMFSVKMGKYEHSFPMSPGDMILMKNGAQKRMKHSVIAKDRRVSLTFREQIRSKSLISLASSIEEEEINDLKESCLIDSLAEEIRISRSKLINLLVKEDSTFLIKIKDDKGLTIDDLSIIANLLNLSVRVLIDGQWSYFGVKESNYRLISLKLIKRHFSVYNGEVLKLALGDESSDKLIKLSDSGFYNSFLNKIDPRNKFVNKFDRMINFERAALLIHSFLRGSTGVVTSSGFNNGVDYFSGRKRNIDPESFRDPKFLKEMTKGDAVVKGAVILGFAGCGKSRPVQMALDSMDSPMKILLISPRVNLLADWKLKVSNKNVTFKTYESALKENLSKFSLIIIDEFPLTPRGYTDVIAYKSKVDNLTCRLEKKVTKLLLIGDPLQASYYSESDDDLLAQGGELSSLEIDYPRYLLYSHRLPKGMKSMMDINMLGSFEGETKWKLYNSAAAAFSEKAFDVILVAGRQEKTFFGNFTVMTFGESQGLTFNKVCIALTEDSLLASDNHMMVGLTRAKETINFIKGFGYPLNEYVKKAGNKLIGKVLQGKVIKRAELENMSGMEDVTFITEPPTFGGHEDKVQGDPWMKSLLTLTQREDSQEVELIEPDIVESKMKVHINITDKSYALMIINDQLRAKENREFKSKDSWSNQFKDNDQNLNLETSTGPVNFEAIFPRHQTFDDVTFWMAVKKRLSFSNPLVESEKLNKAWIKGSILHKEFTRLIRVNSHFRPDLFEKALNDFEDVRMRKSEKLIMAHAGRSDPDWDIRNFLLFMKSQLCKKAEKAFCDAKAGQTIACFAHGVLFKFSAWCRYAELKINEVMPEAFYVHSKKNFDELERWVKGNFIGPICVESDYEAFDASQDSTILAFECLILKDVGWPHDLIEDYKTLKLELGCKLGMLAIMRFTGEFGTFFFNTLANMAFTFCRYNVNRTTPICFAGDDMCILTNAKIRNEMNDFIGSLKLKAKVEWKINPIFCGWILSRRGILKLPSLVYYRLNIAKEKGNLKDCIDSYMIEAGYAYRKGAFIEELLDEDQMSFHQLVIRSMIKSKHLMKGSSIHILEDLVDSYSDGV